MVKGSIHEVEVLGPEDPASQEDIGEVLQEMKSLKIPASQGVIALGQVKKKRRGSKTIPHRDPVIYEMFRQIIDLEPVCRGFRSRRTHAQVRICSPLLHRCPYQRIKEGDG